MQKKNKILLAVLASICVTSAYPAIPVDLEHQSTAILNSFGATHTQLKEISRSVDANQKVHIRLKQYFSGVPVWGGDAMVHMSQGNDKSLMRISSDKNTKMNGFIYQDLQKDLLTLPADKSSNVLHYLVEKYTKENKVISSIKDEKTRLIVYIDKSNKAHWAYLATFTIDNQKGMPAKPTYIIDAETLQVYHQWDKIETSATTEMGGGFGGNRKMGKLTYDGLRGDLPALTIEREATTCYLKNKDVAVIDENDDLVISYNCETQDRRHNKVYWDGALGAVNGGYSPENDALYVGHVIQDMYLQWYKTPALVDAEGNPMLLKMRVHADMDNAYWDGEQMTFGDGITMFYPLVSIGVGAHEVSHGFTEQHSGLEYYDESGGLNESFSDMAAQAAEFYSANKNSWQIGPEITKHRSALRYMDVPSKDCNGAEPGDDCSIDKTSQYHDDLDVHYSSGIFNRVFYLMATSDGWNTKKAFDVMVAANQYYWTPTITWSKAACGVLNAAKDLGYDSTAAKNAFTKVEVDFSGC